MTIPHAVLARYFRYRILWHRRRRHMRGEGDDSHGVHRDCEEGCIGLSDDLAADTGAEAEADSWWVCVASGNVHRCGRTWCASLRAESAVGAAHGWNDEESSLGYPAAAPRACPLSGMTNMEESTWTSRGAIYVSERTTDDGSHRYSMATRQRAVSAGQFSDRLLSSGELDALEQSTRESPDRLQSHDELADQSRRLYFIFLARAQTTLETILLSPQRARLDARNLAQIRKWLTDGLLDYVRAQRRARKPILLQRVQTICRASLVHMSQLKHFNRARPAYLTDTLLQRSIRQLAHQAASYWLRFQRQRASGSALAVENTAGTELVRRNREFAHERRLLRAKAITYVSFDLHTIILLYRTAHSDTSFDSQSSELSVLLPRQEHLPLLGFDITDLSRHEMEFYQSLRLYEQVYT